MCGRASGASDLATKRQVERKHEACCVSLKVAIMDELLSTSEDGRLACCAASRHESNLHFIPLELADRCRRGIVWKGMNRNFLLCLISIVLVTSCTNSPNTAAVTTAPVATPTPENYALYSDFDLQIYSETIDRKIREALKNNNPSQAQELGRKRQELIAEFRRRGLKRKPAETNKPTQYSPHSPPRKQTKTGLPGQD